ncbi:hypothetical protein QFC21_004559 [Naganishia friedmannii]|uniref:Uncharacterized protein n=1 Tax=Naganishia friedmannii TaxID=89922 RepID=A0ACC2VFP9_9TREE|nr:hypothetical protein QFC21_004559 [Naganishia friedmannii]
MVRVTEDTRWYCHECSTAFPEPVRNGGNDLPLCPNCMSDVVEERDLDAPQDESWFPGEHPEHEEEEQHNMMGFFNPPSMVGNRQANAARRENDNFRGGQPPDAGNPLAALMQMFGGGAPIPGTTSGQIGGPQIRTFRLGNGAGGGFIGGATISIGGPPTLGRDEYGYIRDPWGDDPFGQARGTGRGGERTADEAARERFGGTQWNGNDPFGGGGDGGFGFAEYHPEPGAHVTIEDLLSHFLSGMTGLGGNAAGGSGHLGDYVLSDEGLDQVLEQLMLAAGEHNRPPPASDLVINGLPRIKLDQAALDASQYKDCSICLTELELGQETYIPYGMPSAMVEAERHMSGLVRVSRGHLEMLYSDKRIPVLFSRFSLVPESERDRPRPQAHEENTHTNSPLPSIPNPLGEHGVGGVINNVFHNISRFFTGGTEEHSAYHQENTSTAPQRQENHPTEGVQPASSASHPPGAFPRPVSPTVDDHPDHPTNTGSNATDNSRNTETSSTQHATPSERATASEHASSDHEDVCDVDRRHPTISADNSAARFLSNLFDQRGGSPLSGNVNPLSPGPMGTASYFGRTSSPPQFVQSPSNPPLVPDRDVPATSDQGRQSTASATAPPTGSQENKNTVQSSSISQSTDSQANNTARTEELHPVPEQNKHEIQPQEAPHEPIYPTLIPAEYRERQARREAMIRAQEERSGRSRGDSTDEQNVSSQMNRDYTTPD